MTWRTTWRSRWTTQTPSRCQSRASHRQNVGRTCTSCSTSTPSSLIPPASWRKAPQRTVSQVGVCLQQPFIPLFWSSFQTSSRAPVFTLHSYLPYSFYLLYSLCSFLLENFHIFSLPLHRPYLHLHPLFLTCLLLTPCSVDLTFDGLFPFLPFFHSDSRNASFCLLCFIYIKSYL